MFEIEKKTVTSPTGEQRLHYQVSGTIDIESIAELKRLLLEGLSSSEHLVLDWNAVEDVDFTALQLMCAFNIYAREQGKIFELKNRFTPPISEAIRRLGFMRETGCSKERKDHCLWVNSGAAKA
ncbi:MAG: STAS domain-containing protein [Desulfuromonadaceae bacterium]|nr:STAS domain-containing protein [Desulfuromonas sp.]MDY0185100.1 STAS domain-containing protein [Desulfuromonadaceae bacterium]